MKKSLWAVLLAGLMVFGCAACGEAADPSGGPSGDDGEDHTGEITIDEPVTINFWGWGDPTEQENYQTLVNQFMAENENITVIYKGESATTYMTTLTNAAKNLPDIFYMPDVDFLFWASAGMLKDITNYISQEDIAKLWPRAINEYYYNPKTHLLGEAEGARLYGLPKDLGPFTLCYNKTKLDSQIEKLELDSDEVYSHLNPTKPMTWTEFRTLLKQLDPDGKADGLYGVSHYEIEAAIYSNDANFFTEDASQSRITEKKFTDALQFIADLCLKDNVMPTAAEQTATNGYQRFLNQGAIFTFMGPWDCSEFWKSAKFEYDVLPVPYNSDTEGAKSTTWVGSMGYCISAAASDLKTRAAIKLARYLCYNEEAQRKFYELGQQVPNIVDMANDEYLNDTEGLIGTKGPAHRSVFLDVIDGVGTQKTDEKGNTYTDVIDGKTRPRYYTYQSDWYDQFTEYLNSNGLWTGGKTAATLCEEYNDRFQAVLNEMRASL